MLTTVLMLINAKCEQIVEKTRSNPPKHLPNVEKNAQSKLTFAQNIAIKYILLQKKLPKRIFHPKWRNFAQSGHTGSLDEA